ncbi:protein FAM114A2 [Lucilia sericata]|uniref:protein FAM114A2 n=1 Tax=Lucilia sericata TaxID=13632 RepID=UPI0018A869A7|nr:protein FAM114A2 [Lucilia sericata]
MSSKLEDNNQNGWDLDDDNDWDDWGDAEDTVAEEDTQTKAAVTAAAVNNTTKAENNNSILKTKAETTNSSENNNSTRVTATAAPQQQVQQSRQQQSSGWGSLFGGVVSSVLSTANELTSTVSHGLDKVIGVPDPAELARINAIEEAKAKTQEQLQQHLPEEERSLTPTNAAPVFGLGLVNNVTSLGSKVLNTGLDTLEGIGKKTMNILQENDPLLKNKIKKLGLEQDKPNLSEVLKEAKKENEQLEQSLKELSLEKSKALLRFEVLFENNCGLVHLEALEILSKESQLKIQALKESVSGKALEELLETINEVKELMELEDLEGEAENEDYDQEELNNNLKQAIEDIELKIQFEEITNLWSSCCSWLAADDTQELDSQAVFAKGITSLAETCALEMLKLHKIAELLLVKEHHSTANEVDGIVQLCKQFVMHLQTLANRFASQLSQHSEKEEAKSHINTLFAEMLQARQQIEKAFQLFLPILQIGAV